MSGKFLAKGSDLSGTLRAVAIHATHGHCVNGHLPGQRGDGPAGPIVQRLSHASEEVAQNGRGEVLVPDFELFRLPSRANGLEKNRGAILQELERAKPSPVGVEPAFEPL